MKDSHSVLKTWARRLAIYAAVLMFATTLLVPLLEGRAGADSATASNIEMYQRGLSVGGGSSGGFVFPNTIPHGTCKARFRNVLKSTEYLKQQFHDNVDQIPNFGTPNGPSRQDVERWITGTVDTKIGIFSENNSGHLDDILYIIAGVNTALVPTLEFTASDDLSKPAVNRDDGATFADSQGVCNGDNVNGLRGIPVNQNRMEWRGFQSRDQSQLRSPAQFLTLKVTGKKGNNATGTMTLQSYQGPPTTRGWSTRTVQVEIDGYPDFSQSGGAGTGSIVASWDNASSISIPDTTASGEFGGDTYVKRIWGNDSHDGTAYYFLEVAGDSSRTGITWASGNGCQQPQPVGQPCGGSSAPNCVPFIAVRQNLDLSTPDKSNGLQTLQQNINQLSTAQATLYDYNPSTCAVRKVLQIPYFLNAVNSNVWFFYSTSQDSFTPVWLQGSGNESPFMGPYAKSAGVYQGGSFSCNGSIRITSFPDDNALAGATPLYDLSWSLYDDSCQTLYGTLSVMAVGGTKGEQGPIGTPDPVPGSGPNEEPRIGCDFLTANPLNWIVCPFIKAATNLVSGFDSLINSMLDIDVPRIFDDSTDTGAAFRTAWGTFRTFALVMIIVAALVMVISQALGLEILDAYTIRKVLPRILIVAVGITLSWEIMELAVTASNDLGHAVRDIIYSPFSGGQFDQIRQLSGSTNFVLLLLTTGVALVYGWVGLLTFVITALLASVIAFALLVFRELLIIFLVMIAPFAIGCAILPNTQKAWKLWLNTFWGLLIVFIIISAFIATGRVFSIASATGGTLAQLISILAWFAPYFLIPLAFRLAGGIVASIGGFVNDRSRGLFDSLKNIRGREVKSRGQRFAQGSLFSPDSKATKWLGGGIVNRVGSHVGAMRGAGAWRMGFGAVGAAKRANMGSMLSDEYSKMDRDFAAQMDNEGAMAALIYNFDRNAMSQLAWYRDKDGNVDWDRIDNNISQGRTIRRTRQSVSAAVDALAKSGKVVGTSGDSKTDRREMEGMLKFASGGNSQLYGALKGRYQFVSRQVGHASVGRDSDFAALEEMSLQQWSTLKPWDAQALLPKISTMIQSGKTTPEDPGSRALTSAERDHLADLLFAGQYGAYSNLYQQQGIQDSIDSITSTAAGKEVWDAAAGRYRSKLGGPGAPPGAAGFPPPGSPGYVAPEDRPEKDKGPLPGEPGSYL